MSLNRAKLIVSKLFWSETVAEIVTVCDEDETLIALGLTDTLVTVGPVLSPASIDSWLILLEVIELPAVSFAETLQ